MKMLPVEIGALVPQGSKENGKFSSKKWFDRGVRFFPFILYISRKHVMTKIIIQ